MPVGSLAKVLTAVREATEFTAPVVQSMRKPAKLQALAAKAAVDQLVAAEAKAATTVPTA